MISRFFVNDPAPFPRRASAGDLPRPTRSGVPVSHLDVHLVMTGSAKAHEVFRCVRPTSGDWELVVHLFGWGHPAFGIAPLAVRMGLEVFVPDPLPLTTVFLFHVWGPLVLVVLLPGQCAVLLAVLLVCQLRAAGVSAGALRFRWHSSLLLSAVEDLPQLEADDVPHLFAVRYFPVGHGGFLLSCGYSKGPGGLLRRGPFCFSFYCNTITRGNYLSIYFTILHCATFKSFEGSVVQLVCVGDA